MKKIYSLARVLSLIISFFLIPQAFAGNPVLVSSIRDNAVLTLLDVQEEIAIASTSQEINVTNLDDPIIELSGTIERLDDARPSLKNASTSEEITTHEELELYAKSLMRNNSNLSYIIIKPNSVAVTRKVPAKFLGVIDLEGHETLKVISWGNGVSESTISRPWWGMLSSYSSNELSISNDIFRRMKSVPPSLFTTHLNPTTKARIISEIHESLIQHNGYEE